MYMLFVYVCMHAAFLAWAAKWWKNCQSSFSAANGKLAMDKVLFEDVLPTVNTFQPVSSPEAQAPLRHRFHLQKRYMQVRFGRICLFVFSLGDLNVPQLLKQNPMDLQVVSNMFSHVYPYLGKVSRFDMIVGPIVSELGWNHRVRTHIRSSIQKKHRHSSKDIAFVCFLALQQIHEHVFYDSRYW